MYVIGHALFAADLKLQPTVTMGIVSKVNRVAGIPVMIQVSLYKICLLFFSTWGRVEFGLHVAGLSDISTFESFFNS